MEGIFKIADDILEEKKGQKMEENLNDEELDDEDFYRKPQIFIDQIMKFGDIFDEQDIKDEINTLIVAVRHFILDFRINFLIFKNILGS